MSKSVAHWSGTPEEQLALFQAIRLHCVCEFNERGALLRRCAVHGVLYDQRALDGLLTYRRLADHLRQEEGVPLA